MHIIVIIATKQTSCVGIEAVANNGGIVRACWSQKISAATLSH